MNTDSNHDLNQDMIKNFKNNKDIFIIDKKFVNMM